MSDLRDFNPDYDDNKIENKLYQRTVKNNINIIELITSDPISLSEETIINTKEKELILYSSPQGQSKISAWFVKSDIENKGFINSIYLSKRRGKKQYAYETFTLTPQSFFALLNFVKESEEIDFIDKGIFQITASKKISSYKDIVNILSNIDIDMLKNIDLQDLKNIDLQKLKNFGMSNELKLFKEELELHIENNDIEVEIEKTLRKHQNLLSLLIPAIDSIEEFQYNIEVEHYDTNIVDINTNFNDKMPNLIELKRPDMPLLTKGRKYRNNTYKPSIELAGAIQQANVQRSLYTIDSKKMTDTLIKSIIICGNKTKEFVGEQESIFLDNFNIIKYNNKDLEIITYDELIERIEKLIKLI